MRAHVLRSRHHQDGPGDGAGGPLPATLSDMIEHAHGAVRASVGGPAGFARPMAGHEAEDMYDAEVATVSGHLAAVEAVLFPIARHRLPGGRGMAAEQQRLTRRIERMMRLIEGRCYGDVHAIT